MDVTPSRFRKDLNSCFHFQSCDDLASEYDSHLNSMTLKDTISDVLTLAMMLVACFILVRLAYSLSAWYLIRGRWRVVQHARLKIRTQAA